MTLLYSRKLIMTALGGKGILPGAMREWTAGNT